MVIRLRQVLRENILLGIKYITRDKQMAIGRDQPQ